MSAARSRGADARARPAAHPMGAANGAITSEPRATPASAERFDRAYFDKWYRDPAHRVRTDVERARQVAFALAAAELLLERPVRTVLDVGAGEGHWQPVLARLRPALRYTGVDPSTHAVARFGAKRHILLGGIETLDALPLAPSYDLVCCVGMLYYLSEAQFRRGIRLIAERSGGLAYLELFAKEDELEGDLPIGTARPAAWYRREMRRAGWTSLGQHCWVTARMADRVSALERA